MTDYFPDLDLSFIDEESKAKDELAPEVKGAMDSPTLTA